LLGGVGKSWNAEPFGQEFRVMMERLKAVWRATAARDLCPTQSTPELRMLA